MDKSWKTFAFGAGAIILITFLAHSSLTRADFAVDDAEWVTENLTLRTLSGLKKIWTSPHTTSQYCPMVASVFWVEYHLWELNPMGFHIVNIVFHSLNAVMLWIILKRLSLPDAWIAALIFSIHPTQVETMGWVSEFKNILSGFFSFAFILLYLRPAPSDKPPSEIAAAKGLRYLTALFIYACALLSKSTASVIPPTVLLIFWWKRGRITKHDVIRIAPMFALAIASGLFAKYLERTHNILTGLGAENIGRDSFSVIERILIAGRALWFYIGNIFYPVGLSTYYTRWTINTKVMGQYLYPVAFVVVIFVLWRYRARIGRGPLTALLFFFGALAPLIGFVNFAYLWYSYVADHFPYLACIGIIALSVSSASILLNRLDRVPKAAKYALALTVILSLGATSWKQGVYYHDMEELLWHNLKYYPNSSTAQFNLGAALTQMEKYDKAVTHLKIAISIAPEDNESYDNLGYALEQLGRLDEAIYYFNRQLTLNPDSAAAYNNMGYALLLKGSVSEALMYFRNAIRIWPNFADAYNNIGAVFAQQGKIDQAAEALQKAISIAPDDADARVNMGNLYLQKGDFAAAVAQYREALRINPDHPIASKGLQQALEAGNANPGFR